MSRCQKDCIGILHFLSYHIIIKNIGICNLFQENRTMISHFMKIKNVYRFEGNYKKQFDNMFHFVGGVGVNLNIWLGNVGRKSNTPFVFYQVSHYFGNFELWFVRSHKEWAYFATFRIRLKFDRNITMYQICTKSDTPIVPEFTIINQSFTSNL